MLSVPSINGHTPVAAVLGLALPALAIPAVTLMSIALPLIFHVLSNHFDKSPRLSIYSSRRIQLFL